MRYLISVLRLVLTSPELVILFEDMGEREFSVPEEPVEKKSRFGELDVYDELTVGGHQTPRFGFVDMGIPRVRNIELDRMNQRDHDLMRAQRVGLGLEPEDLTAEPGAFFEVASEDQYGVDGFEGDNTRPALDCFS